MSCRTVQKSISAFLDGQLPHEDRKRISLHLASCGGCSHEVRETERIRGLVGAVPQKPAPPSLVTELRVLASHERERIRMRSTWGGEIRFWHARLRLAIDNLMRPLALPFAGGLVSALVLFSMLVPNLNFIHNYQDDVPVGSVFYQEAGVTGMAMEMAVPYLDEDFTVELTIDENGQIANYSVPDGKLTEQIQRQVGILMLYTEFSPAMFQGQPRSGKVTVSFRRSRIVVRG